MFRNQKSVSKKKSYFEINFIFRKKYLVSKFNLSFKKKNRNRSFFFSKLIFDFETEYFFRFEIFTEEFCSNLFHLNSLIRVLKDKLEIKRLFSIPIPSNFSNFLCIVTFILCFSL